MATTLSYHSDVGAADPAESSFDPVVPARAASPLKRWLMLGLRFAIVVALYAFVARSVDFHKLAQLFVPQLVIAGIVATMLVLLQAAFCAWRWRFLASTRTDAVPRFWLTFWVYEESLFCNQLLPSTIGGDVLRVLRWQGAGVRGLPAAASVFLDRLSGLNGAAAVALLSVPLFVGSKAGVALTLLAAALSLTVFAGTIAGFAIARWPKLTTPLRRFPRIWDIAETLRRNLTWDRTFFQSLGLSVIGHVLGGLAAYVIALALGIAIAPHAMIFVTTLVVLISMVPITIAGWGLREASYVTFLAPFGVASTQAFALGLVFGLVMVLTALPGGIAALLGLTKSGARQSRGALSADPASADTPKQRDAGQNQPPLGQ